MYIYIVKINLRNLKNVMTQKEKLEREGMCRNVWVKLEREGMCRNVWVKLEREGVCRNVWIN